jgi:hypothetical protein
MDVGFCGYGYHKVVMGIYQLFAFSCHYFLHTLNVLDCHLIAGIGHTGMAVLLFVKQSQFSSFGWDEYHLVIYHSFCVWYG